MIQPITLLGAGLCIGVLALKYRSQPKNAQPSTPKQRLKTAKVLLAALAALMAITYSMRSLGEKLDGTVAHEPSFIERVVLYFTK